MSRLTHFSSIDRLNLSLAHLDSVQGNEVGLHHATFRLSTHDLAAPVLGSDSENITFEVTCPFCGKKVGLSSKGRKVYYLKARQEKADTLSLVKKRDTILWAFILGTGAVFISTIPLFLLTDESFRSRHYQWPIILIMGSVAVLICFLRHRHTLRRWINNGSNLFVESKILGSRANEMDSGPYTEFTHVAITSPDSFASGGHRIAKESGRYDEDAHAMVTDSDNCKLVSEFIDYSRNQEHRSGFTVTDKYGF